MHVDRLSMELPIHVEILSMELHIRYFKGSLVEMSKLRCISVIIIFANCADPVEMPHHA